MMHSKTRSLITAIWGALSLLGAKAQAEDVLDMSRFGPVKLYGTREAPASVLFLVTSHQPSARMLALRDFAVAHRSFVALIDADTYLANVKDDDDECASIAGEIERLSQVLQKNAGLSAIFKPILVGEGAGAGIAYVTLVDGAKSFSAGVSLDFCPTLPLAKAICTDGDPIARIQSDGSGSELLPKETADGTWRVALASPDTCKTRALPEFKDSRLVPPLLQPNTIECAANVCPLFATLTSLLAPMPKKPATGGPLDVDDLPLVLPPDDVLMSTDKLVVVLLSGDGGWASIDKALGEYLNDKGIPTIGFDSLSYFWRERKPETIASDLGRVTTFARSRWDGARVAFVGYSFGADVLPFALSRFDKEAVRSVLGAVLLNPSKKAEFEVDLSDWLPGADDDDEGEDVAAEIKRVPLRNISCIYGSEEDDTVCRAPLPSSIERVELPGSHHFDGDYVALGRAVIDMLQKFLARGAAEK